MSVILEQDRVVHVGNFSSPAEHERRLPHLEGLRMTVDALKELASAVRNQWPERYPVPAEIDALLCFVDYTLERLRRGDIRHAGQLLEKIDS